MEDIRNDSPKSLQTDRIDLYWLHRDDLRRPLEPMLDSLHGFQQAGKIRYYACSNWTPGRIREAQTYTGKQGYSGFVAIHSYLEALAVKAGMSISQLVLAYLWSHSFPVIPIVGCRTQEQLDDSVTAVGSSLREDAMTELARLTGTV